MTVYELKPTDQWNYSWTVSGLDSFAGISASGAITSAYASIFGGFGNTVSAQHSGVFGGLYGLGYQYGQIARASGRFASNGDCQTSDMVARVATSNATPTNLYLDGSSARLTVAANSTGRCTIRFVSRSNTATGYWATGDRCVSWTRGVLASTTAISAIDTIGTDRGSNAGAWPAGMALTITADTTNGAIDIQVTGITATNLRNMVSISDFAEVTFA